MSLKVLSIASHNIFPSFWQHLKSILIKNNMSFYNGELTGISVPNAKGDYFEEI